MNALEKLKVDLYTRAKVEMARTLEDLQDKMDDAITEAYDMGREDAENGK